MFMHQQFLKAANERGYLLFVHILFTVTTHDNTLPKLLFEICNYLALKYFLMVFLLSVQFILFFLFSKYFKR